MFINIISVLNSLILCCSGWSVEMDVEDLPTDLESLSIRWKQGCSSILRDIHLGFLPLLVVGGPLLLVVGGPLLLVVGGPLLLVVAGPLLLVAAGPLLLVHCCLMLVVHCCWLLLVHCCCLLLVPILLRIDEVSVLSV